MTTTAASPFLSDAVEPQYVHGPAARYAELAGRGSLSASTSRSSSVRRGRATTPPPRRSGMSCIS
jgi:hypothetical protein